MELKFDIINAKDLEIGDVFYCTPDQNINEFGEHYFITGTDQIFIKDDEDDVDEENGNFGILVNGGWSVWFTPSQKVVRMAHYRDIVRVIEMVQKGNPDMQLGPNDSNTLIENMLEDHPDLNIDLLANLDNYDNEDDSMDDEIEDINNDDLPF